MPWLTLYLLLLKATLGSFSGLASLPILREDFVVQRRVLTDRELNTSIVIGRSTPGPKGLYVVSIGYYISGLPGALAGWLALVTPALLAVVLLKLAARWAEHPTAKQVLRALVLGSAGVSLTATLPLAADALVDVWSYGIAAGSLGTLLLVDVGTVWVIAAAAAITLFRRLLVS